MTVIFLKILKQFKDMHQVGGAHKNFIVLHFITLAFIKKEILLYMNMKICISFWKPVHNVFSVTLHYK
jgi:hypothetical protein